MKGDRGSHRFNQVFGYVDDELLDLVEQEQEERKKEHLLHLTGFGAKRKNGRRWLVYGAVAACICFVLVIPAGAVSGNWFGLQDMVVSNRRGTADSSGLDDSQPSNGDGNGRAPGQSDGQREQSDGKNQTGADEQADAPADASDSETLIALSGYQGSPQVQALAEWNEFLENYDTDGEILDAIGNDVFVAEGHEDWSMYNVYSYEMGEKLDEIVEKYGLKLHSEMNVISPEELNYRVGGSFMDTGWMTWAYMYEDGTFQFDGDASLTGSNEASGEERLISFQMRRVVKGTFDEVVLNIGDVEDFVQWQYMSENGERVLLGLGSGKALIFGDFEECFIAVNILEGTDGGVTKEHVEAIADVIDFKVLEDVKVPDMRGDSEVSDAGCSNTLL